LERAPSITPSGINSDSSTISTAADAPKPKNDIADTVRYEADFIDYDNENQILQLFGGAQVKYQNVTLQADTIVYTVPSSQFHARGTPQLIEGKDTTVGDFMVYNIKTRRGRVSYALTRLDETSVTGSNIVKTQDNCLYIEQGDYTSCQNPEHPHYYFYGRHIKVIPQDKVISRPVIFNVGDAPIAALPYFVIPLQRGRRSGWLTPSWGGSVAHGGYVDNLGYYYAPNDYFDASLSAKAQEFNSFVFNARGRYNLRYVLDGEVSGRYVVDNRLENSERQWALDYRHNQLLAPDGRTRLSGYGSIISNRTFNQLYSDQTYELEKQQLDANMSLSHKFDAINASSNIVWRRNHNLTTDRIVEDMPSLDFRLQNRALIPFKPGGKKSEASWYNNIYYAYNTKAVVRHDAYGNDSLPGFIRPGMEHNANLTSSQKILRYFDVSPYFNMRASMFYGAIDTLVKDTVYTRDTVEYKVADPARDTRYPDYTLIREVPEYFINNYGDMDTLYILTKISPERRHLVRDTLNAEFNAVRSWNAGINMSTRIYGLFPINAFGITAIRHTLTPTVGYAFTPTHELSKTFYNVGISYDRARPKAEQLATFSLSNSFQGKRVVRENKGGRGKKGGGAISGANTLSAGDKVRGVGSATDAGGAGADAADTADVAGSVGSVDNVDIVADANSGGIDAIGSGDTGADDSADGNGDTLADSGSDKDNGVSGNDKPASADRDTASANKENRDRDDDAKREEKFDLLTVSLNTSYNFEAESRKWRDLSLSASTSVSILNVSFSSSFWLYDGSDNLAAPVMSYYSADLTSGRLGASGRFWDGDLLSLDLTKQSDPSPRGNAKTEAQSWDVSLSPSFSYRASRTSPADRLTPTESFNLSSSASLHLTKSLSARWNGNYDFSSNQFSHNNFTFHYDLECWEMRFTWRPEKINPGFHFVVNIKKIPDIKWEQKDSRTTRVL
jgi:lipopolysaccharide assembly outer membrane protein LptD (OstA)